MKSTCTYNYNTHSYYSLISLLILNMFDGIITYIGLKFKFYIEMNVMLSNVYNYNPNLFLLLKVIIPTITLFILFLKLKIKISNITKLFIYIGNILYTLLCIYHIVLLTQLIS